MKGRFYSSQLQITFIQLPNRKINVVSHVTQQGFQYILQGFLQFYINRIRFMQIIQVQLSIYIHHPMVKETKHFILFCTRKY